jgi:hypothetical protein
MIGRKSVVALAVLCALAISAFSVASASATTAFTCSAAAPTLDKLGAHCLTPTGVTKNFGHIGFTGTTEIDGSNEKTASETTARSTQTLAGTLSGVATELSCGIVEKKPGTIASMTNKEEPVGTMIAHGEGTLTYKECVVLKPAGKSCVVKEEMVTTELLTAISEGASTLAFKPKAGTTFAGITIEKCTVEALNNTFPVTGTLKAKVEGATTTANEAEVTTQNTLKFGGNKAGLGGSLTISGRVKETTGAYTPLVLT